MQENSNVDTKTNQPIRLQLVGGKTKTGKRKALKDLAPCVAALVPEVLYRTRNLDGVCTEMGVISSDALLLAILDLRREIQGLKRSVLHPVNPIGGMRRAV